MSFIKKIVGPDEKLIGIASIHWIFVIKGLAWFLTFFAIGFALNSWAIGKEGLGGADPYLIAHWTFWILSIAGAIIASFYFIMWMVVEVGLTTKRVIYKTGWIFIDVKEIDIEEIKGADIDNGILGAILGYGYIFLDSRFVTNINLPPIAHPYGFIKALNKARSALKDGDIEGILQDKEQKKEEKQKQKQKTTHKPPQSYKEPSLSPLNTHSRKERMKRAFKASFNRKTGKQEKQKKKPSKITQF